MPSGPGNARHAGKGVTHGPLELLMNLRARHCWACSRTCTADRRQCAASSHGLLATMCALEGSPCV